MAKLRFESFSRISTPERLQKERDRFDKKNLSLVRLAERLREIVCDYLSPVDKCAAPLRGRISSTARLNFTIKALLELRARGRQNGHIGERFR
jgi:hypothetical protein